LAGDAAANNGDDDDDDDDDAAPPFLCGARHFVVPSSSLFRSRPACV
jgi:hypothetical protein